MFVLLCVLYCNEKNVDFSQKSSLLMPFFLWRYKQDLDEVSFVILN